MAYTSAAISYAVGLSETPCITVCSDLPLSSPKASGIANLKAAVSVIMSGKGTGSLCVYPFEGFNQIISTDKRENMSFFGIKDDLFCRSTDTDLNNLVLVYRSSRIMQQVPFSSVPVSVGEIYGAVRDGKFFKNPDYKEYPDGLKIEKPHFSVRSPIAFLSVYPGMVYPVFPKNIKAIILGTYHSGTMNTESADTLKFASFCKKRGIKIYVSGISNGANYDSMLMYEKLNFKRLPPLSSPCAMLIKFWLLNSCKNKFTDENLFASAGGDMLFESNKKIPESLCEKTVVKANHE